MVERIKVSVQVSTRSTFFYGFLTNLDTDERAALGHKDFNAANAVTDGIIFGANSPKPARMKKVRASGRSANSFVDATKIATAKTAGWKLLKRPKARSARPSALSKPVYVEIPIGAISVKYAWRMPTDLYTAITAPTLASLGIKDAATETDNFDLVWGVNNPKPPRAYKLNSDPSLSTFCNPDATIPAGWALLGGEEDSSV